MRKLESSPKQVFEMLILAIFEQSIELEQALAELEGSLIPKEHILVVFMDSSQAKYHDSPLKPHAFEVGISFATGAAVIGASAGFTLALGPIIWGLIGASSGFIFGVGADLLFRKWKKQNSRKRKPQEATVIIQCPEDKTRQVSEVLWRNQALSVGFAGNPS
jgi:hypothetical protein